MLRTRRLNFSAPIIIATLLGLAGVGFAEGILLPPVSVEGDTTVKASKSYKFCCAAVREINDVRENRFFAELLIESKGHKLAPADIGLTIQSHTGAINVRVSRDGAVENFPISSELLAENPLVVANEPKGSLDLTLQIRIPVPNQKRFRYSELVAGVKEANHLVRKATGILGMFAPQTKDLTFVFASSGSDRPEITVSWNGSPETMVADDNGMLTLRVYESTKENPEVLVSAIPEKILAIPQR